MKSTMYVVELTIGLLRYFSDGSTAFYLPEDNYPYPAEYAYRVNPVEEVDAVLRDIDQYAKEHRNHVRPD